MKTPEPLRIVLATVGSRGDVQPMLALALELQARGHHPVLAAPPDFAAWAQSLGIAFAPLGFDIQQFLSGHPTMLSGHPRRMLSGFAEFMRGQLPMQLSQLAAACHGADALLWTGLAFAAPTVAEQLGLPTMGILYTTSVVPSERHPPPTIAPAQRPHHPGAANPRRHLQAKLRQLLGHEPGRRVFRKPKLRPRVQLPPPIGRAHITSAGRNRHAAAEARVSTCTVAWSIANRSCNPRTAA